MVDEPLGKAQRIASSQDVTAERSRHTRLERDYFLAQLADALTILNGWVYLAQATSCRTRQQCYMGVIQHTVQHITQLIHDHRPKD